MSRVRRAVPEILEDAQNGLSALMRQTVFDLYDLVMDLDRRIHSFDGRIHQIFKSSESCQRIAKIKGVGPRTATAIVATIGEGNEFKNGRHLAGWLGLLPRQYSSGGRNILMNITKRGDQHLRTLLVHGARAVVRVSSGKNDPLSRCVNQLRAGRGFNKAVVAVANKNARIIWAVVQHRGDYRQPA